MRFHGFPEFVLGSKVKLKVLLYLLSENVPTSEREISRILGVSHTAVNKVIKDFHDANLVTPIRVGNSNVWKLNAESYAFKAITSLEYLAKNPPLNELQGEFEVFFSYPAVKSVIIFGSIAEGKEMPDSDIDLFILVDKDIKKNILQEISEMEVKLIRKYGNKLSARIYTIKEFSSLNKRMVENINNGIKVISREQEM